VKVTIKGPGTTFDLTKSNYVASGGFGSIHAQGSTAFKVFQDPAQIVPEAKIQELSVLQSNNIIKPENTLLDSKNKPIGFTMKFVPDTYTLCQLFPKCVDC
jgi:hypothetical protein